MVPLIHGVVTPTCNQKSWDYWFVAQELEVKVSRRSEQNWERNRELPEMIPLRHGVVTPNYKLTNKDCWFVAQELQFEIS